MLCYTLTKAGKVYAGIALQGGKIHLGEEGRGRRLTRVPVPADTEVVGVRIQGIPSKRTDSVLILIKDQSGYRGGWWLKDTSGLTILAQGACARGPEYLAVLEKGGQATIHRTGRLYGDAETIRVRNEFGLIQIVDMDPLPPQTLADL